MNLKIRAIPRRLGAAEPERISLIPATSDSVFDEIFEKDLFANA